MKKISIFVLLVVVFLLQACFNSNNSGSPTNNKPTVTENNQETTDKKATYVNVYPINYLNVNNESDMTAFYNETKANNEHNSNNESLDFGFVNSVWHTLSIDNKKVDCYSARCGKGIHSFAWVDIDTDGEFEINVNLSLSKSVNEVIVLPEKYGITAKLNDDKIQAKINKYGDFTFVFDESPNMALTIFVTKERKLEVPDGYSVEEISPGKYGLNDLKFDSDDNKVYHFNSGVYELSTILVPSDSIIFFDRGCYIKVIPSTINDSSAALNLKNDTKVYGRALFDFSACSSANGPHGTYQFNGENLYIEGLTTINSHSWTMCATATTNIEICYCLSLGYRTFSDGIMLSDCTDSHIHNNFVRTGDDGIEIKSTSGSNQQTDNILIENNTVWTDKGIGFGCIYESNHDVSNVYFKNNSIGFAQACWSDHLGCLTIQMGSNKRATWSDIHFEDTEIYCTNCSAISIFNRANNQNEGGKIKDIYFKNLNVKYIKQSNISAYFLSIVVRLEGGVQYTNCSTSGIYIDNATCSGVDITEDNYLEYSNIDISSTAKFSTNQIKINTEEE